MARDNFTWQQHGTRYGKGQFYVTTARYKIWQGTILRDNSTVQDMARDNFSFSWWKLIMDFHNLYISIINMRVRSTGQNHHVYYMFCKHQDVFPYLSMFYSCMNMHVHFNHWLRNAVARAIVTHIPLLLLQSSRLSVQNIQFCLLETTKLTHCGRVTQICVFNTVKLGTSASSP